MKRFWRSCLQCLTDVLSSLVRHFRGPFTSTHLEYRLQTHLTSLVLVSACSWELHSTLRECKKNTKNSISFWYVFYITCFPLVLTSSPSTSNPSKCLSFAVRVCGCISLLTVIYTRWLPQLFRWNCILMCKLATYSLAGKVCGAGDWGDNFHCLDQSQFRRS